MIEQGPFSGLFNAFKAGQLTRRQFIARTTALGMSAAVAGFIVNSVTPTGALAQDASPAAGASVSGTVTIAAAASDAVGVAGVQFRVDGVNVGAEDTSAPYSVPWDSAASGAGSHTLTAIARDAAGNTRTSAAITVSVSSSDKVPPDPPKGVKAHGKGKGRNAP